MSKIVYEKLVVLPDEGNDYDLGHQIDEVAREIIHGSEDTSKQPIVADGSNKIYTLSVVVTELDS